MQILFIVIPIFIILAIVVGMVATVKKMRNSQSETHFFVETDGNGRTQSQRDYLNSLRVKKSQRDIESQDKSHSHKGVVERYDPIVGSLGESDDEGCNELDGVRLVEHDEAYCDDDTHSEIKDYYELQKTIVWGEILNEPRFRSCNRKR